MANSNSQEQTIYRSLAGQIQLGFYDNEEHFPTANEIARRYQVSYCPAQRALKILEKDGLIKLRRGRFTLVLKKPYDNYLESSIFRRRAKALLDLNESLKLISPAVCYHSLRLLKGQFPTMDPDGRLHTGRYLYQRFEHYLIALGNQTVSSLYYDVEAFAGSTYLDILHAQDGSEAEQHFLKENGTLYLNYILNSHGPSHNLIKLHLRQVCAMFFDSIKTYLDQIESTPEDGPPESFCWEPRKGRTKYRDLLAIELICKINQNAYPVGTLLPRSAVLADIYHVSEITMRRTIRLLNELGVTETLNGVGTRVIFSGDSTVLHKFKELTMDDNMKDLLEAFQLMAIISESVFQYTYPYLPQESLDAIAHGVSDSRYKGSMFPAMAAGLQAISQHCPLAAIREIYNKLLVQLLKGSILQLEETGRESVPQLPAISQSILDSLEAKDGTRLALAYQELFIINFNSTKQMLLDLGVDCVSDIPDF